jgi:hypothetical protein
MACAECDDPIAWTDVCAECRLEFCGRCIRDCFTCGKRFCEECYSEHWHEEWDSDTEDD